MWIRWPWSFHSALSRVRMFWSAWSHLYRSGPCMHCWNFQVAVKAVFRDWRIVRAGQTKLPISNSEPIDARRRAVTARLTEICEICEKTQFFHICIKDMTQSDLNVLVAATYDLDWLLTEPQKLIFSCWRVFHFHIHIAILFKFGPFGFIFFLFFLVHC